MSLVVFLTPHPVHGCEPASDEGWYVLSLANALLDAAGAEFEVEVVSCSDQPALHELRPGLTLRVLQADTVPADVRDFVSWDLPGIVADADLLHVFEPFTRGGEVAIVLARLHQVPVCATDMGHGTSRIGQQLGVLEMADRVFGAADVGTDLAATGRKLAAIYRDLLSSGATGRRAA